jgi:hypothetical protein
MRQPTAKILATTASTKAIHPKTVVLPTTVARRFLNILMTALSGVAV